MLSCVDSETVTLLVKVAPNMLMHTEIDTSASLAVKEGSENPTCTSVRDHKRQNSKKSKCNKNASMQLIHYSVNSMYSYYHSQSPGPSTKLSINERGIAWDQSYNCA